MAREFEGKVIFVTGAAHGQGRATALAFAREGASIVGFDVAKPLDYPGYALGTPDELQSLADEVRTLGGQALVFVGDVRDDSAIQAAVDGALAQFGRIDVLFNNAGICGYGLAHELTEDAWDAMIDINLKGPWLVARRVIPTLIAQRSGVIINNSSIAGLRGMGRLGHYAASKWGLTGLTKSWPSSSPPTVFASSRFTPPESTRPSTMGSLGWKAKPHRRSPNKARATSSRCLGSSPKTSPRRSFSSPATARGLSPALNSSLMLAC